jgi:hypothetical protein
MDLLERYLHAVGQHLPARHRADTLAELRANLEAEIEGREEELDRPLTEAEVAQVLEAHGMPVFVAARYGPQQFLIGPGLFPFYWYTLKRSVPYVAAIYFLVELVTAVLRASSGPELGQRIGAAVGHFPAVLLTFWAVMTLGFWAFELAEGRYVPKVARPRWSASDLPLVEREPVKGQSTVCGLADLIVSILIVVWLLAIPERPFLIIGPGARSLNGGPFGVTPEWHVFYWQIMALMIAMLPLKVMAVLPPLRRWRQHLQLVVNAMGIAVLAIMVQVRAFFVPAAAITADKLQSLGSLNTAMNLGFRLALALSIAKWLWDAWKLMRSHGESGAAYVAAK